MLGVTFKNIRLTWNYLSNDGTDLTFLIFAIMKSKNINLKNIQNDIDELFVSTSSISFMELYGVNRLESSHSEFLVWLLKEYKLKAIKPILQSIPYKGKVAIKILDYNNDDYNFTVVRECAYKQGTSNDRIDIIITVEIPQSQLLNIFLEVKVESDEHWNKAGNNWQTIVYHENYSNDPNYSNAENIFLYLTIDGSQAQCTQFQPIKYQNLYEWVLKPILINKSKEKKENIKIIKDYCKALQAISKNPSKPLLMAII